MNFAGATIDSARESTSEATTLLKFRRLIETHQFAKSIFDRATVALIIGCLGCSLESDLFSVTLNGSL